MSLQNYSTRDILGELNKRVPYLYADTIAAQKQQQRAYEAIITLADCFNIYLPLKSSGHDSGKVEYETGIV